MHRAGILSAASGGRNQRRPPPSRAAVIFGATGILSGWQEAAARWLGARTASALALAFLPMGCAQPEPARQPPLPRIAPMVGEQPLETPPGQPWSFLVGGHLYGAHTKKTEEPASTLVHAAASLAAAGDRFFVSVGDLILGNPHLEATLAFLPRLGVPLYNAPGNHDFAEPEAYGRRFGASYGCFQHGTILCVVLNTEIERWSIKGDQLAFLRRAVEYARGEASVEQVFFFAHKLIFAEGVERYAVVFEHTNAKDGYREGGCNFQSDVAPLLAKLAAQKGVFWFGGDVGAPHSLPLFVDVEPATGITYVALGLGDRPLDCLVRVQVQAGQPPVLSRVPLGIEPPAPGSPPVDVEPDAPLERWSLELWRRHFAR